MFNVMMMPAWVPLMAAVDLKSPLLWGLVIGWIMSVVLHEFGHGVVAYWGGDYTIRERGGLTLNPFQYVDPIMSIGMPVLFMLLGGVPLPGGATYIRHDLLKNKWWEAAVSLAGPLMNLLVLLVICGMTHSAFGIFDLSKTVEEWSNPQLFWGALAFAQALSIVLNLIPIPPLDGFQAIAPFLPRDFVERATMPPMNFIWMAVYFMVIIRLPILREWTYELLRNGMRVVGQSPTIAADFLNAFRIVVWGA